MELTKDTVIEAIKHVKDPELGKTFHELGMISGVEIHGTHVVVTIELTTPACPLKGPIREDIRKALAAKFGDEISVDVNFGAKVKATTSSDEYLKGVKNIIFVGSGKGGVGKSTVAVNIAMALRYMGARVGIMDTDIYGPSIPVMLGIKEPKFMEINGKPAPPFIADIPVLSLGYFVKDAQAIIWRGPLLHNTVKQFLSDFEWGELDYLIVDLPPGTGDVQISISNMIHGSAGVLVTTPQDVALADVTRAKNMFDKVNIATLGVVVNMESFICPHCGKETHIFGDRTGEDVAQKVGADLLGSLPMDPDLMRAGDTGTPIVLEDPDHPVSERFISIAEKIAAKLSQMALR